MKSNHMFEKILPGEIMILYRDNDSYLYARHTGEGMIIERAFVPDTQVKRTNPYLDQLHEDLLNQKAKEIDDRLRDGEEETDFFKVVIERVK